MAQCKHWHNGTCKDCKPNCSIKASLERKAAKASLQVKPEQDSPAAPNEPVVPTDPVALKKSAVQKTSATEKKTEKNIAAKEKNSIQKKPAARKTMATHEKPVAQSEPAALNAVANFAPGSPALTEALSHGERVARLAEKMFAGLAEVYGLEAPWGHILHTAARLHDIGWMYGQKAHHKTSARLIRSGSVEEVEKPIRALVALVARYHRRAAPSSRQKRYAELSSSERRGVRRMAAILRLADALDFSQTGLVKDVELVVEKTTVFLLLDCPVGCAAEVERVAAKKKLFQKVFHKDVSCQCKVQELNIPASTTLAPLTETLTPVTPEVAEPTAPAPVTETAMATPEK